MPGEVNRQEDIIKVTLDYKDLEKNLKASKALMDAYEKQLASFQAKVQAVGGTMGAPKYLGSKYRTIEEDNGLGMVSRRRVQTAMFSQPYSAQGKGGVVYTEMQSDAGKWKTTQQELIKTKDATDKLGKSTDSLGMDYAKLATRAAVVIPIWMALRTVYQGFINAIADSIKYYVDLEKQLAIVHSLIIGSAGTIETVQKLREEVKTLASETGIAAPELVNAFRNFVDAGISAKDAFDGMNASAKLAVAMQGDLNETSRALADIYNLMSDSLGDAKTAQEFFNQTSSVIASLSQTNTFRLNEFTEALKTFAPNAKNAGLNLNQMLLLLATSHTFMRRSSSAGTLLSRVFITLGNNIDKVGRYLNKTIDPATTDNFQLFLELVNKLNKDLQTGKNVLPEIMEMFEIRAGSEMSLYVSNFARFTKELNALKDASPEEQMAKLNEMFKVNVTTTQDQVKIFKELRNQLLSTITEGTTGADSWAQSLTKVNEILKKILAHKDDLREFSAAFRNIALVMGAFLTGGPIAGGIAAGLAVTDMSNRERNANINKSISNASRINAGASGRLGSAEVQQLIYDIQTGKVDLGGLNKKRVLDQLGMIVVRKGQEASETKIGGDSKKTTISYEKEITGTIEYRLLLEEKAKMYGISEIEIEKRKLALIKDETDKFQQKLKIQRLINEEQIKYAEIFGKSLEDEIYKALKGEQGFSGIWSGVYNNYIDTFRKEMASGLTNMVMATGAGELFSNQFVNLKNIFGGFTGKIEAAHATVYDWIVKGHRDGMNKTTTTSNVAGSAMFGASTNASNGGWTLPGFGQGGWFTQSIGSSTQYATIRGTDGVVRKVPVKGQGGMTRGQVAAMGVQSAMIGYSAYQSARAGGLSQGQSIGSGILGGIGGIAGGISGGLAVAGGTLMGLGPVGWAILGIAAIAGSGLLGMGGKKASQTSVETKTTENKISSRIDVTNKNLEIINRNLLALKSSVETYMLPSSAYFAEKRNIEDQFALFSRRGFMG